MKAWFLVNYETLLQIVLQINHFPPVDVYTRKTFPNCKTEDVYTRFAALF